VYGDIYLPVFELREGLARFLRAAPLPLAWLTAPGLLGLLMLLRCSLRRYWPELVLVGVPLLVVALFWYSPRYRFPATPVLVAAAAWAFFLILRWRQDAGGALLTAAAFCVGVGLWWSNRSGFDTIERFSGYCYGSVGVALLQAGEREAAARYFEKSLECDPDNEIVRANLGLLRGEQGDQADAIEFLERAVEQHPDSVVARDRLARALIAAGRVGEGLEQFRQAVRLSPENAELRANYALALARAGRYVEAESHYRAALEVRPGSAPLHLGLGRLLAQRGDIAGALDHFSQAARFDPELAEAHQLVGRVHLRRGEFAAGISALRRAHRLEPDDHELTRELAWALATAPGLSPTQRQEALALARDVNETTAAGSPAALDTLAAALAATGDFPAAIRTVKQAISLAEQAGDHAAAQRCRRRLVLYESGRPYVQSQP